MARDEHRMSGATLEHVALTTPDPAPALRFDLQPLYNEVYAEPPYCEGPKEHAEFVERWDAQITQPGFRIVFAHDTTNGELIGFTFGLPLSRSRWWQGLRDPIDPAFTAENGRRTFAIIELVVHADYRRQGLGRALHDTLLAGRPEERVTLCVRPEPEAAPARAAYASWGYSTVGRLDPGRDSVPEYLLMIRPLGGNGAED